MKTAVLCGLFLLLGIIIGMAIQSVAAFTDTDITLLQKQTIVLDHRLNNLESAFKVSSGAITIKGLSITLDAPSSSIKGTSITLDASSSITIKAGGVLALKGSQILNN